ncbi:MAG TPA: bifunctional 3'-5' exonuclease/DNA polymerase [Streptosporangiaceae bacterium]|nr:bifunctional 3'-5' exonuclease/DNA polymerase [Streptosporangiaceae bacterium]
MAIGAGSEGGLLVRELSGVELRAGGSVNFNDLPGFLGRLERTGRVRWIWAAAAECYPELLRRGVRLARCHDVALVEALLLSRDGRHGEPATLAAAWARLRGERVPRSRPAPSGDQPALFEAGEPGLPEGTARLDAVAAVYADQLERIAAGQHPARMRLLAAAESAGGLAAAEMSFDGLPWRADVHDRLLTGLLGPRPPRGSRPRRLAELAEQIGSAFGGRPVNPDSPSQIVRAFAAEGVAVPSTRSEVLSRIDHPVVPLLLEYKELSRLHAAHGWTWLDTWVSDGRFRPEYVVGAVVSGRWASNGGGALQIPRVLRRAVVADPGWTLVVGDAAQLEPRVLAALAGDRAFGAAAATGDLYTELAGAFGGDRRQAKLALLSAMYGGSGGEGGQLLAVLRRRFPEAAAYVEDAAREGEEGGVVRSVLGRSCPPPSAAWRSVTASPGPAATRAVRARGRFTRNFVVQASAADWAIVLLAGLRRRLAGLGEAHLVFFQHDEVVVHCPVPLAEPVVAAIAEAAQEAGRLVFGATPVRFPVQTAVTGCYADAK